MGLSMVHRTNTRGGFKYLISFFSCMPRIWKTWTTKEIDFLKKNYKNMFHSDIANALERGLSSVEHKCRELGLKSGPRSRSHEINWKGGNNPNWKGGVSKDHYHYKKIQKKRYPQRVAARQTVACSVREGRLKKPTVCESCGKICSPHAHHEDYSKPLYVVWLCKTCHRQVHANRKQS